MASLPDPIVLEPSDELRAMLAEMREVVAKLVESGTETQKAVEEMARLLAEMKTIDRDIRSA